MPLSYPDGTVAEHRACRSGAVAFDVSHLGTVRVEGPGAFELLAADPDQRPAPRSAPGRAQYTHLLDRRRLGGRRHHRVVGGRRSLRRDAQRLQHRPGAGGRRRPTTPQPSGPSSPSRAPRPGAGSAPVAPEAAAVGRFAVTGVRLEGRALPGRRHRLHRRGRGRVRRAGRGGRRLLSTPCSLPGWSPAGLGARDTLRLEAGLPLHGHELGPGITPLQAGLDWVVGWDKGDFRGPRRPGGRAGRGPAPTPAGAAWPTDASRPARTDGRRWNAGGRHGDERQLLTDARAGHRPRPGGHGGRVDGGRRR